MACNENLFGGILSKMDELQRDYSLQGNPVQLLTLVSTALDAILITTVGYGIFVITSTDLQLEFQQAHEEYIRTATSTQTKNRLNCQDVNEASGIGKRNPNDVKRLMDGIHEQIEDKDFGGSFSNPLNKHDGILDLWGNELAGISNCIESQIEDSFLIKKQPGPRTTVQKLVKVCDRWEETNVD